MIGLRPELACNVDDTNARFKYLNLQQVLEYDRYPFFSYTDTDILSEMQIPIPILGFDV